MFNDEQAYLRPIINQVLCLLFKSLCKTEHEAFVENLNFRVACKCHFFTADFHSAWMHLSVCMCIVWGCVKRLLLCSALSRNSTERR